MNKSKILDVLNSFEVVDEYGGDDFSILVESSEENLQKLEKVGVGRETALKYGDKETFCIVALAFGEGYADSFEDGLLKNKQVEFMNILDNIMSNVAEEDNEGLQQNKEKLLEMYRKEIFSHDT